MTRPVVVPVCESSSSTAVAVARSPVGTATVTQSPDFHRNALFPIVFTMTQNVSVPEKTLEHWASLCVAYRYRSLAAQWWPVNGVDIDLQALPAQPGKAIQLELKTITPADSLRGVGTARGTHVRRAIAGDGRPACVPTTPMRCPLTRWAAAVPWTGSGPRPRSRPERSCCSGDPKRCDASCQITKRRSRCSGETPRRHRSRGGSCLASPAERRRLRWMLAAEQAEITRRMGVVMTGKLPSLNRLDLARESAFTLEA
jgi:hypothetical protein